MLFAFNIKLVLIFTHVPGNTTSELWKKLRQQIIFWWKEETCNNVFAYSEYD